MIKEKHILVRLYVSMYKVILNCIELKLIDHIVLADLEQNKFISISTGLLKCQIFRYMFNVVVNLLYMHLYECVVLILILIVSFGTPLRFNAAEYIQFCC